VSEILVLRKDVGCSVPNNLVSMARDGSRVDDRIRPLFDLDLVSINPKGGSSRLDLTRLLPQPKRMKAETGAIRLAAREASRSFVCIVGVADGSILRKMGRRFLRVSCEAREKKVSKNPRY
jgi:hypothetical protein